MSDSKMTLNGRNQDGNAELTYNLAHDAQEVRGFGQPVSQSGVRQMINDYHEEIIAAERLFDEIDINPNYEALRSHPDYQRLKIFLGRDMQTVSGVFGKEIILQILAQRKCDGIRYVIGVDKFAGPNGGKNTVILMGVEEVPDETSLQNGEPTAQSRPLSKNNTFGGPADDSPINGEVHKNSYTLADYYREMPLENNLADKLLGTL